MVIKGNEITFEVKWHEVSWDVIDILLGPKVREEWEQQRDAIACWEGEGGACR